MLCLVTPCQRGDRVTDEFRRQIRAGRLGADPIRVHGGHLVGYSDAVECHGVRPRVTRELSRQIANHLKKSYFNWNKDTITDDIILKNLADLSSGELRVEGSAPLSSHQELRGTPPSKKFFHKNQKHKNQHHKHKRKF